MGTMDSRLIESFPRVNYHWVALFVLLVLCSCSNAGPVYLQDGGPQDTSADSADDQETVEMIFDGEYLFDYGVETYVFYYRGENGLHLATEAEYEYNELEKPISIVVDSYYEDGTSWNSEYSYTYDEAGKLVKKEHLGFMNGYECWIWDIYIYDELDRIISTEWWVEDQKTGEMIPNNYSYIEYGEDGRVSRTHNACCAGRDYDYYDDGKLKKSSFVDPGYDFEENGSVEEYYYDLQGRLTKAISKNTNEPDIQIEEDYFYINSTSGRLTEYMSTNGTRTKFEWDDLTLTSTSYDEYNEITQITIRTFTEAGSSFVNEIFPAPPYMWSVATYGNGYIGGYVGQ